MELKKVDTFEKISIVTMCFNMGMDRLSRVKKDTRSDYYEYYVKSLMNIHKMFDNIICFCDKECADYLKRSGISEHYYIVEMEFTELPFYEKKDVFSKAYEDMQRHVTFLRNIYYPRKRHGSCIVKFPEQASADELAEYTVINHSKVSLLNRATKINPFKTNYFYWLDAGCLQERYAIFWDKFDYCFKHVPQGIRISINAYYINKFRMTFRWTLTNIAYCWISDQMAAPIFGGDIQSIKKFEDNYRNTIHLFLKHGLISSEQAIITYMLKLYTKDFDVAEGLRGYHSIVHDIGSAPRFII